MANDSVWPTAGYRHILVSGDNIQQFTAGGTILAGQVVAINLTGPTAARTVQAAVTGTTGTCVGIAIEDASTGEEFSVACRGCIAYGVNGKDNATIDQGDPLAPATTGGTVSAKSLTGGVVPAAIVGYALEDAAAYTDGLKFLIDINPTYLTPAA